MKRYTKKPSTSAAQPTASALQKGFSLVEVLIGGLVLVVGLIFISQFFASAMARVVESDIRSVLSQVANQELEAIRGLPYEAVAIDGGWPDGDLVPSEERQVGNLAVKIERDVRFWVDAAYEGPFADKASYKRITITVSAVGRAGVEPVELVSNVAGGAEGGTLLVHVVDDSPDAEPVPGAQITVVNTNLGIDISAASYKTNDDGILLVPALPADDFGNYLVTASKFGCNSDSTSDFAIVEGALQEVWLTVDDLSDLVIRVVDTEGDAVEGINLSVTGPQSYAATVTTGADGEYKLINLCCSFSEDYLVILLPDQGYDSEEKSIHLEPGETGELEFVVDSEGGTTTTEAVTTTTDPSTTTTIGSGTTTTTSTSSTTTTTLPGIGSLEVTVIDSLDHNKKIKNAWVNLVGVDEVKTNKNGKAFFDDLDLGDYELIITAEDYEAYSGEITITGATSITIELVYDGSHHGGH